MTHYYMLTQSEVLGHLRGDCHHVIQYDPENQEHVTRRSLMETKRDALWNELNAYWDELETVHTKYRDRLRKFDNYDYLAFMLTHVSHTPYVTLTKITTIEAELQKFVYATHVQIKYEDIIPA